MTIITFILIVTVISRWNDLRHKHLGGLWGALENMAVLAHKMFRGSTPVENEMKLTVMRYIRMCMLTLFFAAQGRDDLSFLEEKQLILPDELQILKKTSIGTRPLLLVGWFSKLFDVAYESGYGPTDEVVRQILLRMALEQCANARGAVGATLGVLGCPVPFTYTHLVYWIVQLMLVVLAVDTGIYLAVMWDRKSDGDGEYSYPGNYRSIKL